MDRKDIYNCSAPKQKNIPSSQYLMKHSPKLTTHSVTNQVSTDIRKLTTTPYILSNQHGLKLNINSNKNKTKLTNLWKLNNTLLNEK
ncbi:hypothetical protein STEG23_010763 [Scotinomys teguina]